MQDPFTQDVAAVQSLPAVPNILDVVCRTTGMGFAAVARVTGERWIACSVQDNIAFGLQPGGELKVETTICHEIRQSGELVVIDHVDEDETFHGHPTPRLYGFQSYISVPILMPDGRFFGTLCAIDPNPARPNRPEVIGMFKLFAEMIAFHLDAHERLTESRLSLAEERRTAELREQFIAVLGHDLRNPLAAVQGGLRLIEKTTLEPKAADVVTMLHASVWRMAGLIDNVLDFARGRLGGGLTLRHSAEPIEPVLRQVISELVTAHPSRIVEACFRLDRPVQCDPVRIGQLLSNLIANALTHGEPGTPVVVEASTTAETFELSVSNNGEPISAMGMAKLFRPFERGSVRPSQQGLGLGLYIASQIAEAHGGALAVTSTAERTTFLFSMPRLQAT